MDKEFDISELLLTKSFDELNTDERQFVLSQVEGSKEYDQMRFIALQSKDEEQEETESKRKAAVLAEFDKVFDNSEAGRRKNKVDNKKTNYKALFYLAAAAVGIIFIINILPKFESSEKYLAENKKEVKDEKEDSLKQIENIKYDDKPQKEINNEKETAFENQDDKDSETPLDGSPKPEVQLAEKEQVEDEIHNEEPTPKAVSNNNVASADVAEMEADEEIAIGEDFETDYSNEEISNPESAGYTDVSRQQIETTEEAFSLSDATSAQPIIASKSAKKMKQRKQDDSIKRDQIINTIRLVKINENHYTSY